jgi:hypothetical protein
MDVTFAADGLRIPQTLGDGLYRPDEVSFRLRLGVKRFEFAERAGGENGPRPGAKILRREVLAGNVPEIGVDVGRLDAAPFPGFVDVLE